MASVANRRSVMVLYSDPVTPINHCVRIVLAEKDINVEIIFRMCVCAFFPGKRLV